MLGDFAPGLLDGLMVGSLRIAVVFVPLVLLAHAVQRWGPRTQVLVWRSALVLFVLISVLPASFPRSGDAPLRVSPAGGSASLAPRWDAPASFGLVPRGAGGRASTDPGPRTPWVEGLAALWFLGFLILTTRLLIGGLALRRRVRSSRALAEPQGSDDLHAVERRLGWVGDVALRTTRWPGAPALVGLLRPVVLLPETSPSWSRSQRRAVLTHELMHLRNRDPWATRLAELLRLVFWFHPAVLYALRENARAQEFRCDHEVLVSGVDPVHYAESLIRVARESSRRGAYALAFSRGSNLEERVRRVLSDSRREGPGAGRLPHGISTFSVLAILGVFGVAGTWAVQSAKADPGPILGSQVDTRSVERPLGADVDRLLVRLNASALVLPTSEEPRIRVQAPTLADAQGFLDQLEFERSPRTMALRDPNSGRTPGVTVELHLPPTTHIDLSTANSPVVIRWPRLQGSMTLGSGRGDLDIELKEKGSRGRLAVNAGLGDITLRLPDADACGFEVHCPMGQVNRTLESPGGHHGFEAHLRSSMGNVSVLDLE